VKVGSSTPDRTDAVDPPRAAVVEAVARAIAEDLLPLGDLSASLVGVDASISVEVVSRDYGVVAGRACAIETLNQVDSSLCADWMITDGGAVSPGDVVGRVHGPLRSVLTAERTVLNFLGHLSGVATLTRRYVDCVAAANPSTRVLDTRKTTPGLRALEKAAVRAGGGHNHRGNLSDGVMIKDNHLAGASIADAVARARRLWPGRMVEVECERIEQVREAVAAGATVIMLDNMHPDEAAACVPEVHAAGLLVEASGGVSLERAPLLAAAGVDLVSVGALTHSAPVLDLGFDLPAGVGRGA
jgi:nicotinate-nucleotide pyrophosphorylase (carboxylating)